MSTSQLVSTPATSASLSSEYPYLPPSSRSTDASTNERATFNSPSAEQRAAIGHLKAFDEGNILAWLTFLRSLQPGTQLRAGPTSPGCLTSQHLSALSTLKPCHDEEIKAWLDLALIPGS